MSKDLCIFEDDGYTNLSSLSLTRPTFELRVGMTTIREKISRLYPDAKLHFLTRDYLATKVKESGLAISINSLTTSIGDTCLLIDGTFLPPLDFAKSFPLAGEEEIAISGESLVCARLKATTIKELGNKLSGPITSDLVKVLKSKVKTTEISARMVKYPWDLININGEIIQEDYKAINGGQKKGFLDERAAIYGPSEWVHIGEGSRVEANVLLNAEDGPIYIGKKVKVRPPTIIDGPCFIGDGAIIDGAKIRPNVSIGEVCRIAGEVEESIIYSYSNKHHDGFLGHAYLGQWVNIGAMATNSDLKNNYGEVRVYVNGKETGTGSIKVGCFIGDHTKIGIGTLLNTGTVIGVACNVFGADGMPPKYLPSFAWGGGKSFTEYKLDICLDVSQKIMARRKVAQTEGDREILNKVYELTAEERKNAGFGNPGR